MMKKILLLLGFIILAFILSLPYLMGHVANNGIGRLEQGLNVSKDLNLKFAITYKPKYLTANMKVDVTTLDNKPVAQLNIPGQVGPLIFKNEGWLNPKTYIPRAFKYAAVQVTIDSAYTKMLSTLFGREDFYNIHLDFAFDRSIDGKITLTPLTINSPELVLAVGPLELDLKNKANDPKMYGEFSTPSLQYNEVTLTPLSGTFTSGPGTENFFQYIALDLNSDVIIFKKSNNTELNISKGSTGIRRSVDGDLRIYNLSLGFAKLKVGLDEFGPFNFNLHMKNINEEIIKQALKPVAADQEFNLSTANILELLSSRPTADLNLNLNTTIGNINFNVSAVAGDPQLKNIDPASILATAKIDSSLQIEKTIAYALLTQYIHDQIYIKEKEFFENNKTATKNPYSLSEEQLQAVIETWLIALLDNLRTDNYLVETANQFSIKLKFDKNILTVNEQQRTDADIQKLKALLDYTPAPEATVVPAPEVAPAPAVTPPVTPAPEAAAKQ